MFCKNLLNTLVSITPFYTISCKKLLPGIYHQLEPCAITAISVILQGTSSFCLAASKWAYQAQLKAAKETLYSFFKHDKNPDDQTNYIAVLHRCYRKLIFHPHLHFVFSAVSLNKHKTLRLSKGDKYFSIRDNLKKYLERKS